MLYSQNHCWPIALKLNLGCHTWPILLPSSVVYSKTNDGDARYNNIKAGTVVQIISSEVECVKKAYNE